MQKSEVKEKVKKKINPRLLKLIVSVLTVILVLVIVFAVDGCKAKREAVQEEVQILSENENSMEMDDAEDIAIETAYVTLYYPGQWEEYLSIETEEAEVGQSIAFNAQINGQKHWLFTLYFGGAMGMPVGVLDSGEGFFLDITVEMSDYIPDESWTREDADLYCAMQEGVNYIIDNLRDNPAFSE